MNILPEAIYNQHRKLRETLREQVDALINRRVDAGEFVAFLKRELLSRARSEERHLYPAVDALVREHGRPTATMTVDHEFISDYARRIERLNDALILENSDEQAVPEALLRQLAVELEAVVQLHLTKEERVYLPLFEQYMTNGEQQALLDKIRMRPIRRRQAWLRRKSLTCVKRRRESHIHSPEASLLSVPSRMDRPIFMRLPGAGAVLCSRPILGVRADPGSRRHLSQYGANSGNG